MSVNLIQMTDLHLFTDPDRVLAGVRTRDTFNAVTEHIRDHHPDFDWLVLTGDLAHDEQTETYAMLRDALGDWVERCRLIPGNHDNRDGLRTVFPEFFGAAAETLDFEIAADGWRIFGLDSHIPGEVTGWARPAQIDWLTERFAAARESHLLAFIHHPPVPINVDWLDKLGLRDADKLLAMAAREPRLAAICAGHVHQEFDTQAGATRVLATPSTCVQFGQRAEKSFDTRQAGYRVFELDAGGMRTRVERLVG